ncbi:MAG: hypothetical protein JWN89_639 [Parcubacteria group bacterium]|nr:hypothetical protein [Parcubacteria group bacterium]
MTEKEILKLIQEDSWMMETLRKAESLNLKDWAIGAGFIRNKIWDHLHGYTEREWGSSDVDLVYFDEDDKGEEYDEKLSEKLKSETGTNWEVVNEHHAHVWNKIPPYTSVEDAISKFPETVTAIGVRIRNEEIELITPYGIEDNVSMIIRPTPIFEDKMDKIRERVAKKGWMEKWPKLKYAETE